MGNFAQMWKILLALIYRYHIHYGLKVVFCFRHFTAYHYHHSARVLTGVKICRCLCTLSCGGVSNMLLALSVTFHCHYYIWDCMSWSDSFQTRWLKGYIHSSCYYHHQIGSIKITHCYHIFSWLCAWDVCYIIFCPEKPGFCFHY